MTNSRPLVRGVNRVLLTGTVCMPPMVKAMPSGGVLLNMKLSTCDVWRDRATGQNRFNEERHSLCVFGELASELAESVKEGDLLSVQGKLRTRRTGPAESPRYFTEVLVQEAEVIAPVTMGVTPVSAPQEPVLVVDPKRGQSEPF